MKSQNGNNVELTVKVGSNEVVEFVKDGRHFIEGREGTQYSIRVRNNNPFRVKAVVTVDGVSVVTGKLASELDTEAGYVLSAYESTEIKGYRLDNDSVAAFKFVKAEKSYAQAEKGASGTTGVIGVRVFKEKTAPAPVVKEVHYHHSNWSWPYYYYHNPSIWCSSLGQSSGGYVGNDAIASSTYATTTLNCTFRGDAGVSSSCLNNLEAYTSCGSNVSTPLSASTAYYSSLQEDQNPFTIGSTFGAKTESRVTETTFVSESCLGVLELFYTTREGLIALGIDVTKTQKVVFPTAFSSKYAQPPANWVG